MKKASNEKPVFFKVGDRVVVIVGSMSRRGVVVTAVDPYLTPPDTKHGRPYWMDGSYEVKGDGLIGSYSSRQLYYPHGDSAVDRLGDVVRPEPQVPSTVEDGFNAFKRWATGQGM